MDSLRKSPPPKTSPQTEPYSDYIPSVPSSFEPQPMMLPDTLYAEEALRPQQAFPWKKWLLIFSLTVLLLFLCVFGFFLYKGFSVGRSIQLHNTPQASFFSDIQNLALTFIGKSATPLHGAEKGRINILLLGRAGKHYPGENLTDTIMIMSIDTQNKKVSLLSLPRDLFVPIPGAFLSTKINSVYQYGLSNNLGIAPLRASIETITGQTINYYFVLDFDGFEKVIDTLHGIQVDVVRDFYDPTYPGKNYSYETFEIKKGWQTLDGATALKYVRERHNDPEGDFGRAKRQQQVIQAIKEKAFSLGTFFNIFAVNDLLNTLGENVFTDMTLPEMESFLKLTKTLDTTNINSVVVDAWKKDSLLRVSHIQSGDVSAFILVPRIGNWSEVHDLSDNIFHLDEIQARKTAIVKEKPTLTLLTLQEDSAVAKKIQRLLLDEIGFSQVSIITPASLKNRPKESMIVDRTALGKPYSLDELLKKFTLKKETTLSSALPQGDTSDFALTLGQDIVDTLSFTEDSNVTVPDDTAFPEVLPPQPSKQLR